MTDEPKNPGGRPSSYSAEVQAAAEHYLEHWAATGDKIPSIVGLACELRVTKQTLYNWGDENPVFLDTLSGIKAAQERESLSKGLDGTFNSTITKLVLANHGYADKQDVELYGKGGGAIKTESTLSPSESYLAMLEGK